MVGDKAHDQPEAHGLDFVNALRVFEGATYTFEDDRFSYGEQRFVSLGLLAGIPVSVVHTESEHEIRVVSFRKATKREAQIYFDAIQDQLGSPEGGSCSAWQGNRRASRS